LKNFLRKNIRNITEVNILVAGDVFIFIDANNVLGK